MQAKPLCYAYKVLLKIYFILKTSVITVLEHCLEDLNNLGTCLNLFEAFLQKIEKKRENRKKRKRKQKKEKGRGETN
jgi:hypothetical protein